MTRRVLASLLLACLLGLAAMAVAGCSKNHRIVIQSNTCWTARIDGQATSISEECGNVNFRVAGEMKCVVVTKTTDTGYVRVRIDEGAWVETSDPRGSVKTCR